MPLIDLTQPIPTFIEKENMVHTSEYDQVIKLINNRIDCLPAFDETIESDYFADHEVITITGTRGGGKTTFLRSIIDNVRKNKSDKLIALKIIDPTLIEEKGHIFLTVIAIIKEKVDEVLNQSEPAEKMKWELIWRKLAAGLPTIDGIGQSFIDSDWQDPEYSMDNGIRSVTSAWHLARDFRNFIKDALKRLGNKSAFLIAFDDIDVDFRKGILVLEMIRKYFGGARIITLLSGDMKLYSQGVRKYKWKNFGKTLLINEGEIMGKMSYYNDLITELESQYLLKVLRTDGRVHLKSLYEKVRISKETNLFVKRLQEEENLFIVNVYEEILKHFGIHNRYQQDVYISFLLGLPIRSQIQLLNELKSVHIGTRNLDILAPFISDLIEKSVDTTILETNTHLFHIIVLKLLVKSKEVSELYQLQPLTADASMNGCLMGLSLIASDRYREQPYLIFDYFIRLGLVKNLSSTLRHIKEPNEEYSTSVATLEGMIRHTGMYQDKVLRDMLGNLNAYLRASFPDRKPRSGQITLEAFARSVKQRAATTANRFDAVFSDSPKLISTIAYMPLTISKSGSDRGEICYSVYTLLATIGELLRKFELNDLPRGIVELSQPRIFIMPDFTNSKSIPGGTDYFQEDMDDHNPKEIEQFQFIFEDWANDYQNLVISPHLLGKISTRFYYALQSIESNEKSGQLGDMMHLRIVAFLNSVLIEEAREHFYNVSNFTMNNPSTKDSVFGKNLSSLAKRKDIKSMVLFEWMTACPLFKAYLNPNSKVFLQLQELFEKEKHKNFNISLFPYLNRIVAAEKGSAHDILPNFTKEINRLYITKKRLRYQTIINELILHKLPFSWFRQQSRHGELLKANSQIRMEFEKIFPGQEWSSTRLKNLRNYIASNKIIW